MSASGVGSAVVRHQGSPHRRRGILEQISVGCWPLLALSSGKTLQVVLEVLLCAEATSHAENVRWHDLGMQLNIVPRAMPEIARVTEFVMHLCGLCRREPQRVELALYGSRLRSSDLFK